MAKSANKRTVLHLPAKQVAVRKTSTKIPETAEIIESAADKAQEMADEVSMLNSVERAALEMAESLPDEVDDYATKYADSVAVQRRGVVPIYGALITGYANQIARFPRPDSERDPLNPEMPYDKFQADKKRNGSNSFYKVFAGATPEGIVIQKAIDHYTDETLSPDMTPEARETMRKSEVQRMGSLVKFYKDAMNMRFQFEDFNRELNQLEAEFIMDITYEKDQVTIKDQKLTTSTYPISVKVKVNPGKFHDEISVGQFLAYDVTKVKKMAGELYEGVQWKALHHRNKKDSKTPGQGKTQPGGTDAAEGLNINWGTDANLKQAIMHLAQVVTWMEDKEHSVSLTSIIKGKDKEAKADLLITLQELKMHIDPLIAGNEGFISGENLKRNRAEQDAKDAAAKK